MATVAIIHAAEDALPARALAEKLRAARLNVVLEKPAGEELRNAVKGAQVTIALWSPRSVAQPALAEDVAFARGKSKLIHASMQNAAPPEAFRGDKVVNLTGWRGEDDFGPWRELAKLVTDRAGVGPLPPPAPRPPSGFFTPGAYNPNAAAAADARGAAPRAQPTRSAPQQAARSAPPRNAPQPRASIAPQEPSSGGGNRGLIIGAIVFIVVAAIGAGGYYFWSQGQGTQAASSAWESVDHNSAGAIRSFLADDPGEFRNEAETALAELEERSFEAASDSDTIEAFETFLNDFPESSHALAARGRIAELRTLQPSSTTPADASTTAPTSTTNPDLLPPGAAPATETTGAPVPLSPPTGDQTPTEQPPLPPTTP